MTIRWPWVSSRYARFLESCYQRALDERDAANRRADLAVDQLIAFTGRAPISNVGLAQVTNEAKAEKIIDSQLAQMFAEDEGDFSFPRQVLGEEQLNA